MVSVVWPPIPRQLLLGEKVSINIGMSAPRIPIAIRFPLDLGDIRLNVERFHSSYTPDPETGCWLWHAGRHRQGYGMFGAWDTKINGRKMVTAHRASWRIHRGDPGTLNIMHVCDRFHCVNPDHLALGTQSDTIRKTPRELVGWPPGRPRLSRLGRMCRRRERWQYKFTDQEIQFLRTAPFTLIRQRWPDTDVKILRARRARARIGYRWLPWPEGLEHLQPPAVSAKAVVDPEN